MDLFEISPERRRENSPLVLRAYDSFNAGRYYAAARLFKEAYEKHRERKWLLANYATCIRNAGHIDFSLRIYEWLMERIPHWQELEDVFRKTRLAWEGLENGKNPTEQLEVRRFQWKPGFPRRKDLVNEDFHGVLISLCMIVRNEAKHVERAIRSVDYLMDEIVVVDTGSTDGTIPILESLGITPYQTEWNHDFSEARNYALSKATRDWILVLDADETISYFDVFYLKELVAMNPDLWGFTLDQRDYSNLPVLGGISCDNDGYEESRPYKNFSLQKACRLFRNMDEVSFTYPVYEIVEESIKLNGGDFGYSDVPIHHYGRVVPIEEMFEKRRYYISILDRHLHGNETPQRKAIYCGNIARAYLLMKEFRKAETYARKGITFNPESPHLHADLGNQALMRQDMPSAIGWFDMAIELAGDDPFPEPYLRAAQCHLTMGDLRRARELCRRCLEVVPGEPQAQQMLRLLENAC